MSIFHSEGIASCASASIEEQEETKAEKDMETAEVLEKKKAALKYCQHATAYTTANGGKKWEYLMLPHGEVQQNTSPDYLVTRYRGNEVRPQIQDAA